MTFASSRTLSARPAVSIAAITGCFPAIEGKATTFAGKPRGLVGGVSSGKGPENNDTGAENEANEVCAVSANEGAEIELVRIA